MRGSSSFAQKRTKIVATLGPMSCEESRIRAMAEAGMDVVRINFSHADFSTLPSVIKAIRSVGKELGKPIGILGDLRGPRIRVGKMQDGEIQIQEGSDITLTSHKILGTPERISVSHPCLAKDLRVKDEVLIDDGNIVLEVTEIDSGRGSIVCHVATGGTLKNSKGLNLPGRRLSIPAVTSKDREDTLFAVEHGFDFLALSFVQSAKDVRQLNKFLRKNGAYIPVIAKIENKNAVDEIESIVEEAYGVMVARGDLALEVSLQEIPIAQKKIIRVCRAAAKPVITATQMLESMTYSHKPTRAEVTDVANAVLDGTDAVMLSGESAVGKFPVQTVRTMSRIIDRAERAWRERELDAMAKVDVCHSIDEAVTKAATLVAESLSAIAMLVYTAGGRTACKLARHRSVIPIFALCANSAVQRRLALTWGTSAVLVENIRGTAHIVEVATREAKKAGIANAGDIFTLTAGTPFGQPGTTDLLKVVTVK